MDSSLKGLGVLIKGLFWDCWCPNSCFWLLLDKTHFSFAMHYTAFIWYAKVVSSPLPRLPSSLQPIPHNPHWHYLLHRLHPPTHTLQCPLPKVSLCCLLLPSLCPTTVPVISISFLTSSPTMTSLGTITSTTNDPTQSHGCLRHCHLPITPPLPPLLPQPPLLPPFLLPSAIYHHLSDPPDSTIVSSTTIISTNIVPLSPSSCYHQASGTRIPLQRAPPTTDNSAASL